jgi:hypothetical protein
MGGSTPSGVMLPPLPAPLAPDALKTAQSK